MPVAEYVDTPMRRSILRTANPVSETSNDDEAERRIRRRTMGLNNTPHVNNEASLMEDHESLKNCLKIFHDNKINKDNAWSMTLIDNFSTLIAKHHKTLRNFQIVGSTLDATSKIYGLRVDSVHIDVMRMTSGLGRFKNNHDEGNEDTEQNVNNDNTEQLDEEGIPAPKPVKKKRVRKQVSTITKNKETLNAKLDTIPPPDPLFAKLNSILGDMSSSNRLLLNILETNNSDLKLGLDDKFWKNSPEETVEYNDDNVYECPDEDMIEIEGPLKVSAKHRIRQQLSGYTVVNTPIDDDEEELPPQNNSFNNSQLDYAFDINAEIEDEPANDNYVMDYDLDDGVGNDAEGLTTEDRDALAQCKGLRRATTIIEELCPADTTKLEYSYRALDTINQYWAGPSFWKIRKSRKTTMSIQNSTTNSIGTVVVKKQTQRQRARVIPTFYTVGSDDPTEEDMADFVPEKSKNGQRWKKNNLYRRWDSKKMKLPTDLRIDRELFESYVFAPGLRMQPTITNTTSHPTDGDECELRTSGPPDDVDMDAGDDLNMDFDDHFDDGNAVDEPQELPINENINSDMITNETLNEIGTTFEGAPQMIQQIEIHFAKRAKVIDMKQMKQCCLQAIHRQCERQAAKTFARPSMAPTNEAYKDGAASFSLIYNNLPNMLTKTMSENLSPSVAFYSILHLANEHRLRLYKPSKTDDPNIFLIRQIE